MATGGRLPALERISKEFVNINRAPPAKCKAAPVNPSDMFKLEATIQGPRGSAFEDGTFKLDITFPADYPFRPPQIAIKKREGKVPERWVEPAASRSSASRAHHYTTERSFSNLVLNFPSYGGPDSSET
ncbi:ubiquitin-conjugating enzyme E2 D4 isoform X2 [Rhipicephalus microplus]|uniref:ubiquitin-conjugating enzyme E2 D4 isoform X2 n=1 Tax=Rhipicephalus microplus TaxID=6941 RepID=UPI003F6A6005